MKNSLEKRVDKFFDEKTLSRFAAAMCGDSEDSSYHVLYWYASKAGINLEKGYSMTVLKKLVIKVLSNLYTIFEDIIESQTSEKPELPAKALESLGYLAYMYFNRETLVDKYVDDYNIFLFIKIMLRKLYPYALGLERLKVGKCLRCGAIFAKREGRQKYCCTRCSNNTRTDRYRAARLRRKQNENNSNTKKRIYTYCVAPGSREGNFLQVEGEQEASQSSE